MWMQGLRRASEVQKEIRRTIHGVIKHNIGILYFYFNSQLDNDIIKLLGNILNPLSTDLNAAEFIEEIRNVTKELNYFFDAFYAYKPFVFMLFKFVATNIHKTVKQKLNSFWNKNYKILNAGQIMSFMSAVSLYERVLNAWGITDSRMNGWVSPLLKTFICKLYDNCRQLLANILYDMRNNYITENHKIISRSAESIEGHLNFIFDHYNQIQALEAAELLTETCATILLLFLLNTKKFLREERFPLQIYIAILNNGFLKVIKNFQKKVHNATNSNLSLKQIKAKIDEDFLISIITEIEKICFGKMVYYFKGLLQNKFDASIDFIDLDMAKTMSNIINEFETIISLVDNRFYMADLYYEIFEYVTDVYYKKFLDFTCKITTNNYSSLVRKINADETIIDKAMEAKKTEKSNTISFKMKQLIVFIASEDIDEVIISIMNMNVFFKELIDFDNIDKLLKAKIFFPSSSIDYISSYIKTSLESYQKTSIIRRKLITVFSVNPQVMLFVRNLSKITRESRGRSQSQGEQAIKSGGKHIKGRKL